MWGLGLCSTCPWTHLVFGPQLFSLVRAASHGPLSSFRTPALLSKVGQPQLRRQSVFTPGHTAIPSALAPLAGQRARSHLHPTNVGDALSCTHLRTRTTSRWWQRQGSWGRTGCRHGGCSGLGIFMATVVTRQLEFFSPIFILWDHRHTRGPW